MFWYHLGQRPEAAALYRGRRFLKQVIKNQKTLTLAPWWVEEGFKAGRESRQGALKKQSIQNWIQTQAWPSWSQLAAETLHAQPAFGTWSYC